MMSLRYHVVSLAAVIVALGIGILIGASVVGDRGMTRQQELLISRLDADFTRLVGDRDQLLAEADLLRRFVREAMPHLLEGLRGRAVAVVAVPGAGGYGGGCAGMCGGRGPGGGDRVHGRRASSSGPGRGRGVGECGGFVRPG